MIDQIYLSLIFLTPGLFLSKNIAPKTYRFLLIPSFSIFIWSLATIFLPLNFFLNSFSGNAVVLLVLIYTLFKYKDLKSLIFNLTVLILFEYLNNVFGYLNIVSTVNSSFFVASENLNFQYGSINDPAIQTTFLKFFNSKYIIITIPQYLGVTLLIYNLLILRKIKNLSYLTLFLALPPFFIFCILQEITTIRSHFYSSQILAILIIISFFLKEVKEYENTFLIFLFLFLASRLEHIYLYLPLIFLITDYFFQDKAFDYKKLKSYKLLIFTTSAIVLNYFAFNAGDDLRGEFNWVILIVFILNFLIYSKDFGITKYFRNYPNAIFCFGILFIGLISLYLYGVKSLNSWLFILTHLLDSHSGWYFLTFYFLILTTYLISSIKDIYLKKIFLNLFLVAFLIIISSPLQHSVYGGAEWLSGQISGVPIYNPYDESQTRSLLQLFLSVVPFSLLLAKKTFIK